MYFNALFLDDNSKFKLSHLWIWISKSWYYNAYIEIDKRSNSFKLPVLELGNYLAVVGQICGKNLESVAALAFRTGTCLK